MYNSDKCKHQCDKTEPQLFEKWSQWVTYNLAWQAKLMNGKAWTQQYLQNRHNSPHAKHKWFRNQACLTDLFRNLQPNKREDGHLLSHSPSLHGWCSISKVFARVVDRYFVCNWRGQIDTHLLISALNTITKCHSPMNYSDLQHVCFPSLTSRVHILCHVTYTTE